MKEASKSRAPGGSRRSEGSRQGTRLELAALDHGPMAGVPALPLAPRLPVGEQVRVGDEDFYRITNSDAMRPFLMSIVSSTDHWMFISSNGGLTAGRGDPDSALFPYYTDDKIHDSADITGPCTIIAVQEGGREFPWMPFSNTWRGIYRIQRSLFKNFTGNSILFEELNEDLGLCFRYTWHNSGRFGFMRHCQLENRARARRWVQLLDGLQNVMPSGIGSQFQLEKSTLLDAYKRSELVADVGLGLFTLSSIPIDRPEPAESLRATTVWSAGLKGAHVCLCGNAPELFLRRLSLPRSVEVRGERGAYFVEAALSLAPGQIREWRIVADVQQSHGQVAGIRKLLKHPVRLVGRVNADIERGTRELRRLVASADGLQASSRPIGDARHYANVLFNIMRGGVFPEGYTIDPADLRRFIGHANRRVAERHARWLGRLASGLTYKNLVSRAAETGEPQLERLCREYLPLTFSRRHGDPSRPWNRFSIRARDAQGRRVLQYEGNWRDLFQNWEALATSFPGYTSGMICRFVNASTADGYNPYRITRDGLDWEVVDPHDPWSFIGYWGDHQIIYLLKLLEILHQHEPATLQELLPRHIFSYANVPYRIKGYGSLLKDPKRTVLFDEAAHELAVARVREIGADGKLVLDQKGAVRLVCLAEKLFVPILAKLANFIPEGGIWLNTQRPEWNDANNALVGNGVSVVTLCYLRRYLVFLRDRFEVLADGEYSFSGAVAAWFETTHTILRRQPRHLTTPAYRLEDRERRRVLDQLSRAGSDYRARLYGAGLEGPARTMRGTLLREFLNTALAWIDHSLRANERADGLYEAYNLVRFQDDRQASLRRLYPMLEGQAAALSSGLLSPTESLRVLSALRRSELFRPDQNSYILYPDRQLPGFLAKNIIPAREVNRSALLRKLLAAGNTDLVERDIYRQVHFHPSVRNAADVEQILSSLEPTKWGALVRRERASVLALFERLFDHESFTGRSGTFFAYEGLGSIYWHMVSKLLLAAQESFFRALREGAPTVVLQQLAAAYYDVRAGLGDAKTCENYGAFPMDPYSHTPKHRGACQPGLTGQVKEDILCRWGELGVRVEEGEIRFQPALLRRSEFLPGPRVFSYIDRDGRSRSLRVPAHSLAFTYCQVPILYELGEPDSITVLAGGRKITSSGLCLRADLSQAIFNRTGRVTQLTVRLTPGYTAGGAI